MDAENSYLKLLGILDRVVEANKGPSTGPDDRGWYAEGLAVKFFLHASSTLYLSRGTNVPDFPSMKLAVLDPASIDVLTRAALETFLTFHYVFFAPKTAEEKDHRYWAYRLAGLKERQGLPVSTEEHKQKLLDEKSELGDLSDRLRSNVAFQGFPDKQKRRVLDGEWRLLSWREIAADAGFGRLLASDMYRLLSGYAHSSSLSILQIKQSLLERTQQRLIQTSICTINILAANFISEYCELYPRARDYLTAGAKDADIVRIWIQIGRMLDPSAVE